MASKTTLLIVDDSRSAIAQLEGLLAGIDGVEVVGRARDGAEAVRLAAEHRPDLVLMDIVMPGIDGLTALRLILAGPAGVQVAMFSAVGGRVSLAEEAFRLGAIQVLAKPVERDQLLGLLAGLKKSEA